MINLVDFNKAFEKQLQKSLPLKKEDMKNIKGKDYSTGMPFKEGDIMLFFCVIKRNKWEDGLKIPQENIELKIVSSTKEILEKRKNNIWEKKGEGLIPTLVIS